VLPVTRSGPPRAPPCPSTTLFRSEETAVGDRAALDDLTGAVVDRDVTALLSLEGDGRPRSAGGLPDGQDHRPFPVRQIDLEGVGLVEGGDEAARRGVWPLATSVTGDHAIGVSQTMPETLAVRG